MWKNCQPVVLPNAKYNPCYIVHNVERISCLNLTENDIFQLTNKCLSSFVVEVFYANFFYFLRKMQFSDYRPPILELVQYFKLFQAQRSVIFIQQLQNLFQASYRCFRLSPCGILDDAPTSVSDAVSFPKINPNILKRKFTYEIWHLRLLPSQRGRSCVTTTA